MNLRRRLNQLNPYLIGTIIIALLILANQLILSYSLSLKAQDARIINMAGKQRMLSQQIKAAALQNFQNATAPNKELQLLLDKWESTHQILVNGSIKSNLDKVAEPFNHELQSLTPYFDFAQQFVENWNNQKTETIYSFVENQDNFLALMDNIVLDLQKHADRKLTIINGISWVLGLLSLAIIFSGYNYYIQPISLRIKEQKEALVAKNEQLEHFAYIASHDLQEPLRTITSFIDIVQEEYEPQLDEEAGTYFDFIRKATERMKGLVTGLLRYSRIGQSSQYVLLDLNNMLATIQEDIMIKIREKQANIDISDFPPIIGMETEVRQLFQNLLMNALKFSRPNISPVIEISCKELKTEWQFCVTDNGIGIEKNHLKNIFQIFNRLHLSSEYEGYGIGLAFCKKIVEQHHGKIWVESEFGEGSQFYFTIAKNLYHDD